MACAQAVSIASVSTASVSITSSSTPRRYLVTNTRWACRVDMTDRPRRIFASGSQRGDIAVSQASAIPEHMSRYRVCPTAAQEALLLGQCAHARYVWNLGLE